MEKDELTLELERFSFEKQNVDQALRDIHSRRRTGYFIVGLLVLFFAAFGAWRLAVFVVDGAKERATEKALAQAAAYNRWLIPAAAVDIEPFDDITGANMQELVEMSVWSVLNTSSDPSAYEYGGRELRIPAETVEAAYRVFFGTDVPIVHCTVSGYGYQFAYDGAAGVYRIPFTTISPIYTPRIVGVEVRGDATVITCGLINAGLYAQNPETGELEIPEPDKYIKVTLRKGADGDHIRAIQSSAMPETADPAQ